MKKRLDKKKKIIIGIVIMISIVCCDMFIYKNNHDISVQELYTNYEKTILNLS